MALTAACSRSGLLDYTAPEAAARAGSTGLLVETAGDDQFHRSATSFGGATDITIGTTDSAGGADGLDSPGGRRTYMGGDSSTGGTSG